MKTKLGDFQFDLADVAKSLNSDVERIAWLFRNTRWMHDTAIAFLSSDGCFSIKELGSDSYLVDDESHCYRFQVVSVKDTLDFRVAGEKGMDRGRHPELRQQRRAESQGVVVWKGIVQPGYVYAAEAWMLDHDELDRLAADGTLKGQKISWKDLHAWLVNPEPVLTA